jgi:hypothetical protein
MFGGTYRLNLQGQRINQARSMQQIMPDTGHERVNGRLTVLCKWLQATVHSACHLTYIFLLGLLYDHEDGGSMFL